MRLEVPGIERMDIDLLAVCLPVRSDKGFERENTAGRCPRPAQESTLTLPSFTTLAHCAISLLMKSANFSTLPPPSSAP